MYTNQQNHAAQKPRKWEPVARREERQLYGHTKPIPPSDLISLPPPRSLLWGPSLESAGWGQMVGGSHRLYSWTQAALTQWDLAGLHHTSSHPTYEKQEWNVMKPRPSAKNRSTLVANKKICGCTIDDNMSSFWSYNTLRRNHSVRVITVTLLLPCCYILSSLLH